MKVNAKRVAALILALLLICGASAVAIYNHNSEIDVYVTISTGNGKLDMANERIRVKDKDKSGKYTINNALQCAHEKAFPGGAATGYAVYNSPDIDGVSLLRLWGISCDGNFGYFVNNESAMSLEDEIKENDHIYAFVYSDKDSYSDTYSFFTEREVKTGSGVEFSLSLSKLVFDADWVLHVVKVGGARITVDGEETEYLTDSDGNVTISIDEIGTHIVSATSPEGEIITPPVCVVEVKK